MFKLEDNIYNSRLSRTDKKLKLWRHGGIMLTYKCPASCEFCYYHCGPDKGGLIPTDIAVGAWEGLFEIGGDSSKVHLTGGEPFLYFDKLIEILKEAGKQKLPPADLVETNGSWAENGNEIRKKLETLKCFNISKLKISYDPFHAPFVNIETIRNLYGYARDILGEERVLVRWEKYFDNPLACPDEPKGRGKYYRRAIQEYPCRFTGRAGGWLAELVADKDIEVFSGWNCRESLLGSKGVHIDPYGNVFNGQCSGIIISNLNEKGLAETWKEFDPAEDQFINRLFSDGPYGLVEESRQKGYKSKSSYASKCHLCSDLRQFFFDNQVYKKIIGPYDCYENTAAIKLY